MKKMTLSLVLLSAIFFCACSKNPTIPIPENTPCLEYGQRALWSEQSLQNSDLDQHFKSALAEGLADYGLRLCGDGELSGYRLTVTEIKADYQDAGMRPSLIPSGNALFDVVSGVFVWTVTSGTKKIYRSVAGVDYKIAYTASLSCGTEVRWLVRNDRPHYKDFDDDLKIDLQEHYADFASEIVLEIAELRKETTSE